MINFFKHFFKPTIINKPDNPPPNVPQGKQEKTLDTGKPVQQEAFDQAMTIIKSRLDSSNYLMVGVLLVLAICFLTLFYGYWQFSSTSFNDYSQKLKELNDDRYNNLTNKVKELESKYTSTQSAK